MVTVKKATLRPPRDEAMRTFSLFTTDSRYSVPTLTLIEADDEKHAIAQALANLEKSIFHRAVELREGSVSIYQKLKLP